ncbi:hypothetical protein NDU88_004001 [Pleurodeles waltl]|uniref:Uncharacterized protein n=1 Tax=Pleurodeles waltl TaxID=8319 RepID=A0AAV7V366_PLEWA|nr:hypothetical protein NDU88_004001 [Pleurodeles waltl]
MRGASPPVAGLVGVLQLDWGNLLREWVGIRALDPSGCSTGLSGDESPCGPLGVPPLSRACLRAAPAPGVDFEPAAGYRDHHRRDPCRVSQDQAEPYPLFNGADLRRRVEQRSTNCAGPQHTKLWTATHLLHTEEGLETGAGYRLGACGARVELATGGTGSTE